MYRLAQALLLAISVSPLFLLADVPEAVLDRAQIRYQEGLKRIKRVHDQSSADALAACLRRLSSWQKKRQSEGDLGSVLTVRDTKERLLESTDGDIEFPKGAPKDVIRLCRKYRESIQKSRLVRSRETLDFTKDYLQHLKKLVKNFTRANEIGAAKIAQAEIERISASSEVTTAREILESETEAAPASDNRDLPKGLVLHYTFDDGNPKRVQDHSGSGNDGTIAGFSKTVAHTAKGHLNGALKFTGNDGFVECPTSRSLDLRNEVTLSAYVCPKRTGYAMTLVESANQYTLWIQKDGKVRFADGNGHWVDTYANALKMNEWSHVAGVFRGKKGERLNPANSRVYINGIPRERKRYGKWSPKKMTSLRIGATDKGNLLIDEVMVFNRALSVPEIKILLNR
jgi:hypothetical protein